MGEYVKGKLTWEGVRSLIAGSLLSAFGFVLMVLGTVLASVASLSDVGLGHVSTVAIAFGASGAAAFGVGKLAESWKSRGTP